MKEIIVIRTSDRDGSVFQSILGALEGKTVQILYAAAPDPSALTLRDIEIFPERRQVTKSGVEICLNYGEFFYPLLHGPLPWSCIQPGGTLSCGLG